MTGSLTIGYINGNSNTRFLDESTFSLFYYPSSSDTHSIDKFESMKIDKIIIKFHKYTPPNDMT